MRAAKTAKDRDGKVIRRGDTVRCFNLYTGEPMETCVVYDIQPQGADGTILRMDRPPCLEYPHYLYHRASRVQRIG